MPRKIRTLRHWKQRFDPNASFIWRKQQVFAGVTFKAGDSIPDDLAKNKTKLRRFWESKVIELAEFDRGLAIASLGLQLPDGVVVPDDVVVEEGNGSWYEVGIDGNDGRLKVNGKNALVDFIVNLVERRAVEAEEAQKAADTRAALIESAAAVGVELTDELLDELDDDQMVELELFVIAMEEAMEGSPEDPDLPERPEFLPPPAETDDDGDSDDEDNPLESADSDDETGTGTNPDA